MLEVREPSARYLGGLQPRLMREFELLAAAADGVSRLRELILSLAVTGRLVPTAQSTVSNDPKPQPSMELPCALPAGWRWVRLSDLGEFRGGKTPSTQRADFWGGSIPWITPKDMKRLRLSDSQDRVTSAATADGLAIIPPNSVLIVVRSGILRRTVPTAINEVATTINQDLKALVLAEPELATYVQLMVRGFERYILENLTKVGTTVESIRFEDFSVQPFPLPPLAEQARIVARVDELMRLCDALEAKGRLEAEQHARLLSTLLATLTDSRSPEELAANWQRLAAHFDLLLDRPEAVDSLERVVVQLAVRGHLTRQDPSEAPAVSLVRAIHSEKEQLISTGEIKRKKSTDPVDAAERRFVTPRGWIWVRLEDLSTAIVDCPHSTPKFVESGRLCIDTNSFKSGALVPYKLRYVDEATFTERVERLKPAPGDLVFAREGSVGESLIIPPDTVACLGQRVMLFRLSRLVSNEFVRLSITSAEFLELLLSLHKGIGAKHVNVGDMRRAAIALPPVAEQHRIVARVTQLRRLCADLRQRLAASQATQARLAEALIESAAG